MIAPSPDQLHVIFHALGRDDYGNLPKGALEEYRNHYDAGKEPTDEVAERMNMLVDAGLMERYVCIGGWQMYRVTDEGRRQAIRQAPAAPTYTLGQRRYRKWLDTKDAHGLSFREWLLSGYHVNMTVK